MTVFSVHRLADCRTLRRNLKVSEQIIRQLREAIAVGLRQFDRLHLEHRLQTELLEQRERELCALALRAAKLQDECDLWRRFFYKAEPSLPGINDGGSL